LVHCPSCGTTIQLRNKKYQYSVALDYLKIRKETYKQVLFIVCFSMSMFIIFVIPVLSMMEIEVISFIVRNILLLSAMAMAAFVIYYSTYTPHYISLETHHLALNYHFIKEKIFQYTDIEFFAVIATNKTIRMTMNDGKHWDFFYSDEELPDILRLLESNNVNRRGEEAALVVSELK